MLAIWLTGLILPLDGEAIAHWLEGRFDNGAQIEAQPDAARPHLHVVHEIFRNDAVPGTLIHAQLHVGGPEGEIYRQRVYAFEDSPGRDGRLRMAVYTLTEPGRIASSPDRAGALASLSADDLERSDPGCDFFWQADETGYAGAIDEDACRVTSSRTGREMIITARFTIAPERFTHIEAGKFADSGETAFDAPGGIPNLYDRIE